MQSNVTIAYCAECVEAHLATITGLLDEGRRLGQASRSLDAVYERIPVILEHFKELEEWDLREEILKGGKPRTREYLESLREELRGLRKFLAETKLSLGGGTWEDFEETLRRARRIRDEFYRQAPLILSSEGECPTCRVARDVISTMEGKHMKSDTLSHTGGHLKGSNPGNPNAIKSHGAILEEANRIVEEIKAEGPGILQPMKTWTTWFGFREYGLMAKLFSQLRELGHTGWDEVNRLLWADPPGELATEETLRHAYLTNWQYGGYMYNFVTPSGLLSWGSVSYADPEKVLKLAREGGLKEIYLAGGYWEKLGKKGWGEKVPIDEAEKLLKRAREAEGLPFAGHHIKQSSPQQSKEVQRFLQYLRDRIKGETDPEKRERLETVLRDCEKYL